MIINSDEIVQKLIRENSEFSKLFGEHIKLEQDLEALYSLKYLPPAVESRIKEIKVLKLNYKDKMTKIILESKKSNL